MKRPIIRCAVAFALSALPTIASIGYAQATEWRAPDVDARFIRAGVDTLAVFLTRDGKRERIAYVIDAISLETSSNGDTLIRRVYSWIDKGRVRTDTIVDERNRFTMRRYYATLPSGGANVVSLTSGRLSGSVERLRKTVTIDSAVAGPVYNGATLDLLLRASPLALGYEVEVPAFIPENGVVPIKARVAGSDTVPGAGVYWRVTANFAGLPVTFWIDQTNRRLGRQTLEPGPGVRLEFVPLRPTAR
jgi:hypothetical protein